jgi:hypothetical protein
VVSLSNHTPAWKYSPARPPQERVSKPRSSAKKNGNYEDIEIAKRSFKKSPEIEKTERDRREAHPGWVPATPSSQFPIS